MEFGCEAEEQRRQATPHAVPERRAEKTTASSSRPGTTSSAAVKKSTDKRRVLTRRRSGGSERRKRDLGDSFDEAADIGEELIRDEDMRHETAENNAANPLAWWDNALPHKGRKLDSNTDEITSRMTRMFTLQTQRMDNIEQTVEAESTLTAEMLKAVENNIYDQQQNRSTRPRS